MMRAFLYACMCFALALSISFFMPTNSMKMIPEAQACIPCVTPNACDCGDTSDASNTISEYNREGREDFLTDNDNADSEDAGLSFEDQLKEYEDWLEYFSQEQVVKALRMMATQFTNIAMHQVMIVGQFFDARIQTKTQSVLQTLQADAHRNYHPSKDFCVFGTNVRSLSATENLSYYQKEKLNAAQMSRQLGTGDAASAFTRDSDKQARWDQFTTKYCDVRDNNWQREIIEDGGESGLSLACGTGATDPRRKNLDIDYTRQIDFPRTIDLGFPSETDPDLDNVAAYEDLMALSSNLYGHDSLSRSLNAAALSKGEKQEFYFDLRSALARRNVATNSFNAIVALKAAGSANIDEKIYNEDDTGERPDTASFLGAILKELDIPDDEIFEMIGERPSYYAQMEILAKRIYQNPNFYANLYDTPTNVQRKSTALRALDIMLDRAIYESQLRREMATSVLLSTKLHELQRGGEEDG